jgi:hypothetical protein
MLIRLADLAALDTPESRQEAMKGTVETGRPKAYWPHGEPTRSPRRASGTSLGRSWQMPTSTLTCWLYDSGSIKGVCGWQW